jgi:hypothetical protein
MDSMPGTCAARRQCKKRAGDGGANRVFQLEVFVCELFSVYALATRSVESRKITALYHEALDDAVEDAAAVAAAASSRSSSMVARQSSRSSTLVRQCLPEAFLSCAKRAKVL